MSDINKYYEERALVELKKWQSQTTKTSSPYKRLAQSVQKKIRRVVPEKIQQTVSDAIKTMVKAVISGSQYVTGKPLAYKELKEREELIKKRFTYYKSSAVASGAGTGSGGFLLALADFPILLSIKMKFLFDVASLYGFDVKDYKERLYILYVFQLAFSSEKKRLEVYQIIADWDNYAQQLPDDIESFDWRSFQQEYRDYIDLAKMLQMIPGFGAVFGAVANFRLMDKLHTTANNCYRMRLLKY